MFVACLLACLVGSLLACLVCCLVGLQIIASASSVYAVPWPPSFLSFMSSLRVFLIDIISITKANCAQPMNYYTSLVIVLLGMKLILALLLVVPWIFLNAQRVYRRFRRRRTVRHDVTDSAREAQTRSATTPSRTTSTQESSSSWLKVFKASFMLLFVAYPGTVDELGEGLLHAHM